MPTPVIPQLSDLANIRTAFLRNYYGQDSPTETPASGLAKELGDIRTGISEVNMTLGNRKPPKIIAQGTTPANPNDANSSGGLWINTSAAVADPTATLLYFWNSNTSSWEPISGKVNQAVEYIWTGKHTFRSTFNYFVNATARDTGLPSAATGSLAIVGNKLQVKDASSWKDISIPAGGSTNQVPIKNSNNDFDWTWSDVVRPAANNVFSGNNTFNTKPSFTAGIEVAAGATVAGGLEVSSGATALKNTAVAGTLSVSAAATLAALSATGISVSGESTMTGKTNVPNSASVRNTGFFIGSSRVWLSPTQPANAAAGDLWIQT